MSTRAYRGLGTRQTPQSRPIPGAGQDPNSAGGFTWTVDCWTRLDRFLVLGSEGGTFYIGERTLALENASALRECLAVDGVRTVNRITEISESGRAARNTPAIFALAVACAHTDNTVKRMALDAIPRVCRTGTHLFTFATLVSDFRGWGRSLRRGIGQWYTQDPAKLAYGAIKYRQREGWTHKDMLRLAHPARTVSSGNPTLEGVTPIHERLYNWIVRREAFGDIPSDDPGITFGGGDAERIVTSFERAMTAATPKDTAALVHEYGSALPREALNPDHLNDEVWTALLEEGMPMTALVRNLATMTRKGVIKPLDSRTTLVTDQLTDGERLRKARVHPYAILLAAATYASGGTYGASRAEAYTPVSAVNDALDAAFGAAFGNVPSTGKRVMLALDVSGSMGGPILGEFRRGQMQPVPLSCREGSAAMAMVTRAVEPNCMTVAFSSNGWIFRQRSAVLGWYGGSLKDGIEEFDLSPRRSLRDVVQSVSRLRMGGTDCALPALYATANDIEVDAFILYTDSETWAGDPHPSQALRRYREQSGIPAKMVVVGMASNGFSVADPNDAGSLDVVGFDVAAPEIISDFIAN